MTNQKLIMYLLILLAVSSHASEVDNQCLCNVAEKKCLYDVNDDVMFYVRFPPFGSWEQVNVTERGVIQCWNQAIAPTSVAIFKCESMQQGEKFGNVGQRIQVIFNNYFQSAFTFGDEIRYYNKDYDIAEDLNEKLGSLVILTCLSQRSDSENSEFHPNLHWLSNYTDRNLLNTIINTLNFPENVLSLFIQDIDVELRIDPSTKFTSLEYLSLLNIGLRNFPKKFLMRTKEVLILDLSGNHITLVEGESLVDLKNLLYLKLNHNQIYKMCDLVNTKSRYKVTISLRHNQISQTCNNQHSRMVNMEEIALQYNEMVTLDGMFNDISGDLHAINISHNKLEKISVTDFVFLKSIIWLDLSSNHIRSIDKYAFSELQHLSVIYLDDNFLDFKDNSAPNFPQNLPELSLNNNHLEEIPWSVVKNSEKFSSLHLIGNHIYHIQLDNFLHLSSSNRLNDVYIYLQNNTLTTVDLQGFSLDNLINPGWTIAIEGNPIRCDCSNRQLHKHAKLSLNSYPTAVNCIGLRCHEPIALKNRLFMDLDENLLQCRRSDICPLNCTCIHLSNETFVDCTGGQRTNTPSEVPTNATSLVMSYNPLTSVESLKNWRSLRKLALSNCKNLPDTLENDTSSFEHLVDLEDFNLSSNNLTSINSSLFRNLGNLRMLNVEGNSLTTIPENLFSSLKRLKEIFFKNNNITHIDDSAFNNNILLQELDFSFNRLSYIHFNISHLNVLKSVDFSHNILTSVQINWPANVNEILLSYNKITSIDLSTFPDNVHLIDLSSNELFSINIDSLTHFAQSVLIHFRDNNISTLNSILQNTAITKTAHNNEIILSLHDNSISCDCNLTTLLRYLNLTKLYLHDAESVYCSSPDFMTGQLVSSLEVGKLPCLYTPSSEYLVAECNFYKWNMSDHRIVDCCGVSKLPDIGNITNELYLKNGSLESINQLFTRNWTELQTLSSKFVIGVMNMESDSFAQMKQLTKLFFTHNNNLAFSSHFFSNMRELVDLDLCFNGIVRIHPHSFDGNKNLKHLNLSYNLIEQLPETIFSQLIHLNDLDLSHNRLKHLNSILFDTLTKLEILLLGDNFLNILGETLIKECVTLKTLHLSGNALSSDDLREFHIPYNVKNLIISRNNVTTIEKTWLTESDFDNLDLEFNAINILNLSQISLFPPKININLQNNNISQIVWFEGNISTLDSYQSKSRSIALTTNSFNCDCNLRSFIHYLKHPERSVLTIHDTHLKCSQPEHLKNKLLIDVEDQELFCVLENCPVGCECKLKAINDEVEVNCKFVTMSNLVSNTVTADSLLLEKCKDIKELETRSWNMLKKLYVISCSFGKTISKYFLKYYPILNELTIRESNLTHLPDIFFRFTPDLTFIDLSNNLLRNLQSQLFFNLSNLVELNLSNNQLVLTDWQFSVTLTSLNLAHNEIRDLTIPKRNIHYNLKYLNLSYNKFQSVPNKPLLLFHLKRLVTLDLSHNSIAVNCNKASSIFPMSLQNLNLSHNELNCTHFWRGTSITASKLAHVDVSYNPIRNLNLSDIPVRNFSSVEINMKNCEIASYSFDLIKADSDNWTVMVGVDVSNNRLIECDCAILQYTNATVINKNNRLFELQIRSSNNCSLLNLKIDPNFKFSQLPDVSSCIMKSMCSENCTCVKVMNEMRMFCARMGFRGLPPNSPPGLRYLNLDYNNITFLKGLTDPEWRNLTTISLRNNRIDEISFENVSLLSSLKEIYLDGNQLRKPSGWLANFVNYKYLPVNLTLSSNPWLCDCTNELFQKWLTQFSPYHLVLDVEKMACTDGTLLLTADICSTPLELWKILVPAVLSITIILIIVPMTVFYYRNKAAVLAWIYGKNLCFCCVSEDEIDIEKEYDAFLSYSTEDAEFVINELLPGLEENEPFYKICMHDRDWIAGESIHELIEKSIKSSRRVIIVLTENFIESMWANIEFKLASYQSIQDKINRIIIVVLGDKLPLEKLDRQFQTYISMHSYLKANHPRFWEKLRYAMPHKKIGRKHEVPEDILCMQHLLPGRYDEDEL